MSKLEKRLFIHPWQVRFPARKVTCHAYLQRVGKEGGGGRAWFMGIKTEFSQITHNSVFDLTFLPY